MSIDLDDRHGSEIANESQDNSPLSDVRSEIWLMSFTPPDRLVRPKGVDGHASQGLVACHAVGQQTLSRRPTEPDVLASTSLSFDPVSMGTVLAH